MNTIRKRTNNFYFLVLLLPLFGCLVPKNDTYRICEKYTPYVPARLVNATRDTLLVMVPVDYLVISDSKFDESKEFTPATIADAYIHIIERDSCALVNVFTDVYEYFEIKSNNRVDSIYKTAGIIGLIKSYFFCNGKDCLDSHLYLNQVRDEHGNNIIFRGPKILYPSDSLFEDGELGYMLKKLWEHRIYCVFQSSPYEECVDHCFENTYITNAPKSFYEEVSRKQNVMYRYYE